MDWRSEDFVTVVAVEGAPVEEFVTVLSIGGSPPEGAEEVLVYRLPGERLGFGLKFEGGTSSSEKVRRLFIQSCAPDSPASRACCSWGSLQEGDEVLQIDAVPVTSMTRLDCVRCLKESHVVIKLLVRHSPPPVPPRRKQQQSVLGPPTAFADVPPEAEVYLDLLAQEEEEEMAGLTESESDDTGSSISTVVAPHIDLAKVLSPFEQLERELEADNEETGTPLQPPLSFQDAPLSYGDEKVLPPRPAPRKEFRSGKKRPPPPPPPRTDRPLCPLNVQTIAVVEMDRGDLPRLVDVVPKSVLNCVESRPEQIEGEENLSLVTEYRVNGPIEINVQDNILIKTGECAVISDSKNMKYIIDSKENVQILKYKKENGQSVESCKQNVHTLLDSEESSSIQTDSNKKTTSKTDTDDDNIIIDNQENKPTDSNENRQVIDIKENRLNSADNLQIESPVTGPEENNLELFSQINIYQGLANSLLVNENKLLETEFEEDSLIIIDNKENRSIESSSTSDMELVTQIRVGTPDNLILKQSPIITSTNIVMNHPLTLTTEEYSEIQNPEFAVTKDNFNDETKLTSLENSSKMPTELSSSQDTKEISELVSTNTNLEHSLEHNPKEDERERSVPPAPEEPNTTSPSTLFSIENSINEHTEISVAEKLEQDSKLCPKEKVKEPSDLVLKEKDKIKCSLAPDLEQSSVMKSSTLTPEKEMIEQSLLLSSKENTEQTISDRPEDKNQTQECESATDGIEELTKLNVKKSMDQFTESSAVKELPRRIQTESNECSKTVEQLQLSSLTKVSIVSPTGDKKKFSTNLNPEEGMTELSKEDSSKFDRKEFFNIVTSEDILKEISKNGSKNNKKESLKFLPGDDSVDDSETFNIKKDLKDPVCHNPTEDKVKLSPKSIPKNDNIQVSNFTLLNGDVKESSTIHLKNNKEQPLSLNSPKDNKDEPLSSKFENITLTKSPELIKIVDNTLKPVHEFDITDHNIPSQLLTPIKDTNKFIPELVSNDISLKETPEVTFIQEKVRQSQKPFLAEENLKKALLTGLDSIDNYLNKNIKPTSIEGNLKVSPKVTSVEDFLENSVKYTTSNVNIEDSPKLISTKENTKQTSKRTSAEGKSKTSPKFVPTESSVDEDLLISFTGNNRKQTEKLNLTEVSLKPPSNLTTIEKMIKQSPVLSPRMSSCLDSDTDSETDSDSEDFLLDLPETELLEQGGSVFQPATGALLTASDATFFPFRCWGTSCQLATIGEDDEDSANSQSVPGLSVEEEEDEEDQEEDNSNLEQLSATNRLDNLLLKTEVSGESFEHSDSEAGPSPPDEEPVAAVTPPSAMEEAPLTSSASRLPPDGHEFPPNYTEHNPFEVGTPVLIELDIEKPPPPLPSVPIPKKISTEEVRSPVRLPSWRKDEKSECSVRDKIAMFSSSGDAPSTPRRRFSSTEDVFRPPPPETLPKPAAPSTLDRTHSSLDLSYTPGQYFSTLPRKPPTTSSSLSRATSFSGGSLQTRSQSLIDIGRGSVEDMRKASLNALIEQRRRGISKLRGLVIPEKVSEVATPSNTICDLPEIRSRDSILSSSKALSQRPNATNRWSVGPSITAITSSTTTTTTNSAIPVVMSSPPWKTNNSANLPKYSPAFKRKSLTVYGSTEEPQPLFGNSRHLVESPASLESFTSPTRSDLSFDYKLMSNGKSVLASGRHCTEDDSDNDSAVSSSRSSISPPPTPPPPPLLSPLRRTLSSETSVSAASSTASTLTCGSSDSNRRVLKAQSVEAINRKNVLSSARYSSGKDVKVGSPLIQRKFEEEEQVACLDEVEGPANEEEEEEDEQPPVKPLPAPRRAPVPPKPVQRKLLEMEPEEQTDLLSVLTGNRNQRNRDSLLGDTRRSVSVNDIRKAFEKAEMALANSGRKVNHARVSSLDSTASEDSFTQHYGSVSNLQHEQFGSVTSIASSTSLISPQELQVLIDEANQPLEDFSGTMTMPVHDVVVVVLHREGTTGSVGITLAGGADYEAKEITVHKVLAGSPADRDGRIQKGDRILSINGRSMKGVTHRESLNILKAPRPEVVLVVSRSRGLQDGNNDSQPDDCSVATHISRPSRPPRIPEQPLETSANPVSPSQGEDRGPPVTITLTKDGAGLGFSLEGGKDSPLGDKPLTIKKIFTGGSAEKNGQICAGDELLNVNGSDVTVLSRIEAWGLMKRLPDGPVTLTVRHKLK